MNMPSPWRVGRGRRCVWVRLALTVVLAPISLQLSTAAASAGEYPVGKSGAERVRHPSGRRGGETDLAAGLVRTTAGLVRGRVGDDVVVFRGIPYAASPVADLRWRAPEPTEPWFGVREATDFGSVCAQITSPVLGSSPGEFSEDCPESCTGEFCCTGQEDCLTLNVWTPAHSPDDALPVMVWIHGGGWNIGSGSQPLHDGALLAHTGGVVVITFNYRLGPLGFLAHPLLSAEASYGASGNYGLLDQVLLLEWVRENAREFGGDPSNVTVFGESAGGGSVCHLVASPLAGGLFHRAVIQSASCPAAPAIRYLDVAAPVSDTPSAHEQGLEAEAKLGCEGATDPLACMRDHTPGELFEELEPSTGGFVGGVRFWPIVDGDFLPDAPGVIIEQGAHNAVPLIGGANANEIGLWRTFAIIPGLGGEGWTLEHADATVDPAAFVTAVNVWFGLAYGQQVLALYPEVTTGSEAVLAYERLLTDLLFVCTTRRYVRAFAHAESRTWLYLFTRVPPGSYADKELFGAIHGAEIKYPLGTLAEAEAIALPLTEDDDSLSAAMMSYWVRFAHTGDVNGGGAVSWPAFDDAGDRHLELAWPLAAGDSLRQQQCDLFDEFRQSLVCQGVGSKPLACML